MQNQESRSFGKKLKIPLFWKFMLGIFVVVVIFGSINILIIHSIIYESLEEELQQRSLYISRTISEQAIDQLLYDDIVGLNRLVNDMKSVDASVEYVFILNRNREVVAHTFEENFPVALIDVQEMTIGDEISTIHIQPEGKSELIRDISIPLLSGRAGYARVGLTEEHIRRTIDKSATTLLGMVIIFFITGVAGALVFSYMLTHPVKSISHISENIDFDSIQNKKIEFAHRYPGPIERIMSHLPEDELDTLVDNFNKMVSRLQKAYDELEMAQRKLVQSEKMASVGSLAAGVAHEVNNPLAGMMHCIERMKKNPDNKKEIIKYSTLMEDATNKIEKVVRGLLDFTRQPERSYQVSGLKEMLESAVLLVSHKISRFNIIIRHVHKDPSIRLKVNKNRVEQVFLNLILNSIDAIAEKKAVKEFQGEITLQSSQEGNRLVIMVKDNGIGIPADKMDKVTDPFFTTKSPGEGTGLGLAVSLGILKEHGGDLEIRSIYKQGTIIKLILPVG